MVLKQEGGFDLVAPSPIPLGNDGPHSTDGESVVPRELTRAELREYVQLYSKAAIEAGFDSVEVHAANGYLPDQFVQTVTNERTDEYGGSVDNRVRFPLEVVNGVVETIGAEGLPSALAHGLDSRVRNTRLVLYAPLMHI